jgi:hypothetical protein
MIASGGWPVTCSSSNVPRIQSNRAESFEGLIGDWCAYNHFYIRSNGKDLTSGSCKEPEPCSTVEFVLANKVLDKDFIFIHFLDANPRDSLIDIGNKSVKVGPDGNAVNFTPKVSENENFIIVDGGSLKIYKLSVVLPVSFKETFIIVLDGSLSIEDSQFIVKTPKTSNAVLSSVIVQKKGVTRFIAVTVLDSGIGGSKGIYLSAVPFVSVEGGVFEVKGLNEATMFDICKLSHTSASSHSLFLDAKSVTPVNPISRVFLSCVSFTSCSFGRPNEDKEVLRGGLIGIVGVETSPVVLILEHVTFSSIGDVIITTSKGVVNGGALYGECLKNVLIEYCNFSGCSVSGSSYTKEGSGGALYIKDVKKLLNETDGLI